MDKQSEAWVLIDQVREMYKDLDERWRAYMALPEWVRKYRISNIGLSQFDRLAGGKGMRVNAYNYESPDPKQRKIMAIHNSAIIPHVVA
ncbi:MAG: hypothetical protein WCP15_03515 [bacterium]